MGRINKKNKRGRTTIHSASDSAVHESFYYPIYSGWVAQNSPIFESASAAMCYQISHYKKDLLDHNTIEQPAWLHCVGSIHPDNFDAIELSVFQTTSSIEEKYFEHVNFYKIKDNRQPRSKLVKN